MDTCSARVYRGSWGRPGQCERKGVIERDGKPFCRQHDPDAVAKRQTEARERSNIAYERDRFQIHAVTLARVVKAIADGHNNPRTLAQETLDKLKLDFGVLP